MNSNYNLHDEVPHLAVDALQALNKAGNALRSMQQSTGIAAAAREAGMFSENGIDNTPQANGSLSTSRCVLGR